MVLRLIFLAVIAALVAAFMGKRALAAGLLVGAVLAGIALGIYESAITSEQNEYFSEQTVTIDQLQIKPSGYRPNLYKLTGTATNSHPEVELDGMRLELSLSECPQANDCRPYTTLEEFVETRLKAGEQGGFDSELYFERPFPKGDLAVEYRVLEYRGRKPVW